MIQFFWKTESIEKWHKKLVEFAIGKWSFDNLETTYREKELTEEIK